jgi:hypothetical protein
MDGFVEIEKNVPVHLRYIAGHGLMSNTFLSKCMTILPVSEMSQCKITNCRNGL